MRVIAEAHWATAEITRARAGLPELRRDASLALNGRGDMQARLEDMGAGRPRAMDDAGIDVAVLSLCPPGTDGLPGPEAAALSRDANDRVAEMIRSSPDRLRALMTLPMAATGLGVRT